MKTNLLALMMLAVSVASLTSCTAPKPNPKPAPPFATAMDVERAVSRPGVVVPDGWVLIAEQPPTYAPRGMAKGAGTGFDDGEWIYAGKGGTRWFIPRGGTAKRTAQQLMQEAFSMRTKGQKCRVAAGHAREFAEKSAWTGILAAWGCIGALGQQDVGAVEDIVEVWRDS